MTHLEIFFLGTSLLAVIAFGFVISALNSRVNEQENQVLQLKEKVEQNKEEFEHELLVQEQVFTAIVRGIEQEW